MLERDVAMKFLAPSLSQDAAARARLVREAQAASALEDPNVCAIYAVETTVDGGVCIVMAYCAGGTLRERLRRGSLSATAIRTITLHSSSDDDCRARRNSFSVTTMPRGDFSPRIFSVACAGSEPSAFKAAIMSCIRS